jgi:hypothetical protein
VSLRKDAGITTGINTMSSPRQKRKREEGLDDGNRVIKRSKLAGSSTDVVNTDVEECEPDIGDVHSIKVAETDSLAGCDSETYGNRVQLLPSELASRAATLRISIDQRAS